MMRDAESHAEDDKKRREEIETRNRADQAIYQAEKTMQDMGDKLAASDKSALESAIEGLKSAMTPTTRQA
jgi:molecular chaperone DnaK